MKTRFVQALRRSKRIFAPDTEYPEVTFLLWVVLVFASLLLASGAAAETYNFYFNNAEQGENSSASPSVTVKQGAEGSDEDAFPAEDSGKSASNSITVSTPEPTLGVTGVNASQSWYRRSLGYPGRALGNLGRFLARQSYDLGAGASVFAYYGGDTLAVSFKASSRVSPRLSVGIFGGAVFNETMFAGAELSYHVVRDLQLFSVPVEISALTGLAGHDYGGSLYLGVNAQAALQGRELWLFASARAGNFGTLDVGLSHRF